MAFADLPLVGMLKTRMRWLESRQKLLAENIANSDTPGYRQRDLKTLDFKQLVAGGDMTGSVAQLRTNPMHIAFSASDDGRFGANREKTFETTPDGNSVVARGRDDESRRNAAGLPGRRRCSTARASAF